MTDEELKPCLFCEGAFKMGQEPHDNHPFGGMFYIYHEYGPIGSSARKCPIRVARHFHTKAEAIAAWNTRADDDRIKALTAENEALKKSGRALLNAKHKEAAEAKLWFEKGQALTVENERLRDIADAKIDALTAEVEELREHLSGALETLRDAGVCDDKCSLCNEAFAALDTGITIEAPQEGGWKEVGQPWLWTYDPHLKEKQS